MTSSLQTPKGEMTAEISPSFCSGTVCLPASKSLSHRALICAGLAQGTSRIDNLSASRDITTTMDCLKALGASITCTKTETGLQALVRGCRPQDLQSPVALHADESGSTLRFFIPIAASGAEKVTFYGKPSLLSRPMGIYADLFLEQNLPFTQSPEGIVFHGPLRSGLFSIPGHISSQFVSGLLFALPLLGGGEIAVIPPYESRSYVDLSVEMMEAFGIQIEQPTDHAYRIEAGQTYQPKDLQVDGDYSQLAFFAVLAALSNTLCCENIQRKTRQGDAVILTILEKAGVLISWDENARRVTIAPPVKGTLQPQTIDLQDCPDLGPILCVLAAYTPGTTVIENAARLRYKESDRIAAMEEELRKWNVDIHSDENSITIQGKSCYEMPETVVLNGHNDHRIVMAMSIFGLLAKSPCRIEGAQAVAKSYPAFFDDLHKLHANVKVV